MRRRGSTSIIANPVLVGAVTTLIVVVAVFLAYNANSGLPFVPTTTLKVQISSGANLLPGNEVREGGYRIGIVDDMVPVRLPDGSSGAEITLKLDEKAGRLPSDSTVDLRPRSVLGLKYVEITRGTSKRLLADGATLPAKQARFPVELDDLYSIFDEPTRRASRDNLEGFGDALSQRGASINRAIAGLPEFLKDLEPVARVLSDDDTNLRRFFRELGDAARIVSPVADRYANSFSAGADTFEAWSRDPEALKATITKSVPTLDTGIRSLRVQRPFLRDFAAFSGSLEKVATRLPRNLPRIIPALETGSRVQRRAVTLNRELGRTLSALERLSNDPGTGIALRGLTRTTGILNPFLRFLGPYITVCNYFNYSWTHAGEHLTEPDPTGTAQRTLLNQTPRNQNPASPSIGSLGAAAPANGEPVVSGSPVNLHNNLYSAAINRDGTADCESGQRGYLKRLNTYGKPELNTVVDPHIPGSQGPTFTGRPRVPEGQTFTRAPQSGPLMPPELDP
ncbi:MlaD family protein [Paraconexibacter sp.]|uniref:MlaD family protein n=1 Tax=Paraconexibacter sp. TaxID=2949640 RepID=UPI00356983CF